MNDSHKATWLKRKKLGRSKYLMYFGILPWGIALTLLTSFFEYLSYGSVETNWITIRFIIFMFIGFFVANARWSALERRFEPPAPRRP